MMKLCPIKYGVKYVDPGYPIGNVWLVYENYLGNSYLGDYNGAAYTPQAQDTGGYLIGAAAKIGTKLYYQKASSFDFFYVDEADYSDWTPISNPDSCQGKIVSDGTYLWIGGGSSGAIGRMTLPAGAFSNIVTTSYYNANQSLTLHNGNLYAMRGGAGENEVAESTDLGVTWALKGLTTYTKGAGSQAFASNGSRLVILYNIHPTNETVIEYSDDNGATWSGVVYTFPAPYTTQIDPANSGLLYDGTHFVAVLLNSKTAYSANGASWTAGATIPRDMKYVSQGIGKLVASCAYTELYETTDHGATWTQMTAPTGTGAPADNTYAYWIGDNP